MPPALDLNGLTFGQLSVVRRLDQDRTRAWMWLCRCLCGRQVRVRGTTLKAGRTSSCSSCANRASSTTHGSSTTNLYSRWRAMLDRTRNPAHQAYANYGGRGINVCDRWSAYELFAQDMGHAFSPELELDRIDVNGHYEPTNCRWITRAQQQRNKRTNHQIVWKGQTMVLTDWALLLGIKPNTLVHRIRRGWSLDRALSTGAQSGVLLELANSPAS